MQPTGASGRIAFFLFRFLPQRNEKYWVNFDLACIFNILFTHTVLLCILYRISCIRHENAGRIIRNLSYTVYDMNARINTLIWDGVERRSQNSCRRRNPDRRNCSERRQDPRRGKTRRRSLLAWIRSLIRGRLGVDRRKGVEQRMFERRCSGPRSLLTREELEALLR